MKFLITALALVAALGLVACPRPAITPPTPLPPPPPPPVRVPEGCLEPLSGNYRHAQNPSFQYEAFDDGGTLQLFVERPTLDGGLSAEDGGAVITLNRTPNGFTGATEADVFNSRGTKCRVAFPTDVTSCFDGGIVLRAAVSASVDNTCQRPKKAAPSPTIDHTLLRLSEIAADAGERTTENRGEDAGSPEADGGVAGMSATTVLATDAGNPSMGAARPDAGS